MSQGSCLYLAYIQGPVSVTSGEDWRLDMVADIKHVAIHIT